MMTLIYVLYIVSYMYGFQLPNANQTLMDKTTIFQLNSYATYSYDYILL